VRCREQLEQALFRRGFSFEEEKNRWIRYPKDNGRGRAVVVAQAEVDERPADELEPLLEEIDRQIAMTEGRS
jgi:hypothetical protein